MTEEAKRVAKTMHDKECNDCVFHPTMLGCRLRKKGTYCDTPLHRAADLIESLSAQLDQVTRERDAAMEDLKYVGKIDGTFCEICKHQPEEDCEKRKFENMDCFEWRGVEVEE